MIPLFKVQHSPIDLTPILESGQLSPGKHAKAFEEALQQYIGNPLMLSFANYNMAALIAWDIIGLKPGDEVIASPMSCLASNQPVAAKGGKLAWADIDPKVGSLDPDTVRRRISSKTKAILHYHWCGYPGYIQEIQDIGKEYGIPVIEDAIEAFGAEYRGQLLGNTGADITLFSFQPVRLPNAIEGGALAFSKKEDYEKAILLRDYGINRSIFRDQQGEISAHCDIALAGYGAGLNEINSAVGIQNLKKTPNLLKRQREQAKCWDKKFQDDDKVLSLQSTNNEGNPNYWVYSLLSDQRDQLLLEYRQKGWYSSKVHFRNDRYSLFSRSPDSSLIGVNEFEQKQLSIPCGWWVRTVQ